MMNEVPHLSPKQSKISWLQSSRHSTENRGYLLPTEDLELTANKSIRKKTVLNKKMTLQGVLQKTRRTVEEARFLYRIVKDMPFFADFKRNQNFEDSEQEMLIDLCKNSKYEKYEPTDVIFKEDEPSDGKFYIVLRGVLYVVQREETSKNIFEEQNIQFRKSFADSNNSDSQSNSPLIKRMPSINKSQRGSFAGRLPVSRDSSRQESINSRRSSCKLPFEFPENPTDLQGNVKLRLPFHLTSSKGLQISKFRHTMDKNGADQSNSELILENSTNREHHEIQNTIEQHVPSGKLKNAASKLIHIIKFKGALGENKANTKGNLQSRVAEYGIYRDKIESGEAFGHAALQRGNVRRNATTIAATQVDLLVIQKEHLQVIKDHFYNSRNKANEFLLKYFPCFEDINAKKIIESYVSLLREERFAQNAIICEEGLLKDKIYVLSEGSCQLMKTFVIEETNSKIQQLMRTQNIAQKRLPLATLEKGAFIGEETLFNHDNKYEYTVKVTSPSVRVYSIDRTLFLLRFPRMTYESLKQNHLLRQKNYVEISNSILRTQFPTMEVIQNHEDCISANANQLDNCEGVFQNPILMILPHESLNSKSNQKPHLEDSFNASAVKNKFLDYSHRIYTDNHSSSATTLPQISNVLSLQKIQKRVRAEVKIDGNSRSKVDEIKLELSNIRQEDEEEEVSHTKDRTRKNVLRSQEINRLPMNEFIERSVDHFCLLKGGDFLKPKDVSNAEEFRLEFGREYELNRKKKGWKAALANREEACRKEMVDACSYVKRFFGAANKSKEKYSALSQNQTNTSIIFEKAKIYGLVAQLSKNTTLNDKKTTGSSKPNLRKLILDPIMLHTGRTNQLVEDPTLQENLSDFLFVTAGKTENQDSFRIHADRSFGFGSDKQKEGFSVRKSDTKGPTVQNLLQRHRTIKALNKKSQNTTVDNKSSRLLNFCTPTSIISTDGATNDSFSSASFIVTNNFRNLGI